MDVSHFELVWKPQSPSAPTGTAAVASVLQGYFLEITNLEPQAYRYSFEFVAAAVTDPLRSLAGNTVVFVDTPCVNNTAGFLSGGLSSTTFRPSTGSVLIPARGTALIAVLPSAFGVLPFETSPLTAPNFEVRGYVRIRLPPIFRPAAGGVIRFVQQSETPVKIMLTPQNRATYFDASRAITDQTQASLPLASGAAVNMLPPDQAFIVSTGDLSVKASRIKDLADSGLMDLIGPSNMEAATMMILAMVGEDATDLKALNDSLAQSGIGLTLERREVKQTDSA
jgi:hypothetical protein